MRLPHPLAALAPSATETPELRRAAITVGLRIAIAAALMVVVVIAATAVTLLYLSQHPDAVASDPAESVYIDSKDMIKAMVAAGIAGILAAGGIGWLSARSAIRPLGRALEVQRRFVQDASHELRTPLAILDARVQLAELKVAAGSDAARILGQVRADTAVLTATVQELLHAATGESGAPAEPAAVVPVMAELAASLQDLASSRGITLTTMHDGDPTVRIHADSLRRAILGLVDNAFNHTPDGGAVTLAATAAGGAVLISVKDTGGGITGIEPSRVFDRFAHSTTPAAPRRSYGLGLALVREIAVAAGGSIDIAATGPDGTTMELRFPSA